MKFDKEYLQSLVRPIPKPMAPQPLEIDNDNLFSAGDGEPSCEKCRGRGWVDLPDSGIIPASTRCRCVMFKDIRDNLEKIWKGLSKPIPIIESSPLSKYVDQNLWVTARPPVFKKHLRHVAIRQGSFWWSRVVGDVDLCDAWLGTAKFQGLEILDPDIAEQTMHWLTLPDIAIPPQLLIIRLGMKTAPFRPMAQLLEETLRLREHQNKPTWIFDQPDFRLTDVDHPCNHPSVLGFLDTPEWPKLGLECDKVSRLDAHISSPYVSSQDPAPIQYSNPNPQATTTNPAGGRLKLRGDKDKGQKKKKRDR